MTERIKITTRATTPRHGDVILDFRYCRMCGGMYDNLTAETISVGDHVVSQRGKALCETCSKEAK